MPEHFCTTFDHRYAARGLAMWRSMKAHRPDAVLHVLCMDEICDAVLAGLQLPDVHRHQLSALEAFDAELLQTRGTRSRVEYYFTITPCFPRYLLRSGLQAPRLTYLDSDLFFLSDPAPIFDEMGDRSIGIIEHRFSPAIADRIVYGRFNVGWISFRNDAVGLACLDSWREACLAWCYDRLEADRFADQKYLDAWPEQFASVAIINHPGANLAPWNLGRHTVTDAGGTARADGVPVVFFHAHGYQLAAAPRGHQLDLAGYGVEASDPLERAILDPYESALRDAAATLAVPMMLAMTTGRRREAAYELDTLREYRAARSYVSTLEQQLSGLTAQHRTATEALDAARTETTVERAVVRAERDALAARLADLDAALAAQRAELLAETFKVGALTTAAAVEKEARSAAEQQWATVRQESHALSTRIGSLEARLEIEASTRSALEAQLSTAEGARAELHAALAASRAESQAMAAIAERERSARTTLEAALAQANEAKADAAAALAAGRAESEARAAMLGELQATVARLAADLESAGQRVGALTSQLNREERQRQDAIRSADAARAQLASRQAEMAAREQDARTAVERTARELEQAKAQLEEARSNWYHADGNLKVVKGSWSWKVTGPLRVLRDAIIGPARHG